MKCRQCSKVIPDGFTDCPWCGAVYAGTTSVAIGNLVTVEAPSSTGHDLVIASATVSCALLFLVLNYLAATRNVGPLTLENSAYFLGRCAGALALAALLIFGYCKLQGTKPRTPILVLVALTISSLLTMVSLALPARPKISGIDAATVRRYSDAGGAGSAESKPVMHTKWDPATSSLMKDLAARNEQYVAEISALDETAKPLYTPESFRDGATIQQVIDQLHARLNVADKYADWRPVFSRMPEYVAAVNANEDEKRKFLQGFEATLPRTLSACKAISGKEHGWLQASLDLYQFALLKQGAFVWQNGKMRFRNRADSNTFAQKFFKARALNTEFLEAYWEVRHAQELLIAQLGSPESSGRQ